MRKKAGKETKFDFERGREEYHFFSYTSSSTYSYGKILFPLFASKHY
jgi:hypothetical protein